MSLILEALKKSEAERRLGEAPHLGTLPVWAPPKPVSKAWWALLPLIVVIAAAAWSNRDLLGGDQATGEEDSIAAAADESAPPAVSAEAQAEPPAPSAAAPAQPAASQEAARIGPPAAFANRSGPSPTSARPPKPMPEPLPLPQSMDDLDAMKGVSPENRRRIESGELYVPNPALLAERGPTTETQIITADAALPPPLEELPADGAPLSRDQQAAREQAKFAESLKRARERAQVAPRPTSASPPMPMPTPPAAPTSAVAQPAPAPAPPPPAGATIPLIHDLTLGQRQGLPALKMSVHFYNSDVARRFVIIDGQRLNEGGVMGQELWAREIRPDGVVIEYRGVYFLLPRLGG